ncbi:hemolysin family protein [Microbacter sp. GSS18]|nr:hemolysin family protein [Microbacter sp. GSS18]
MDAVLWNLGVIVLFVLIGGVFAGTEMAIVSLRESQVRAFEAGGRSGRRIARLVRDPNLFLSAVQVGVTVAGFLSSAYGASTIAPLVAPVLAGWGMAPDIADTVAFVGLTLFVAYLSLVFGELVPKRLAMLNAVAFTRVLAPPLRWFAILMRPVIWLLSSSTNLVLRLFGIRPGQTAEAISADEVRALIVSAPLGDASRRILVDVLQADDRHLSEVMRPRPDVEFVHVDSGVDEAFRTLLPLEHSRFPVRGESVDDIRGFVHIRDLAAAHERILDATTVADLVRPLPALPGTNRVLATLATMRRDRQQIVLVVDEFGGTDGIVTLEDLLEELVGEIYDEYDRSRDPEDITRGSGETFDVDGGLILQEVRAATGVELPEGPYETVGGFVVARLGRFARQGDTIDGEGWALRVTRADARRVREVRVTRVSADDPDGE